MTEVEEIKQHIHQVVKKSGLSIPVSFVETTATNSTGCFKGGEFEIEFSITQLQYEKKRQDSLGNVFPSLLHLADVIIAHELGHAKDQMNRNFVATLQAISENIWQTINSFKKNNLKKMCQQYATYNHGVEEIAWDYAYAFMLFAHEEETLQKYRQFSLTTYTDFYPYYFKMHARALRLMEQWENEVKWFPKQVYNYTIVGSGFTNYNQKTKELEINIPHLLRTKPRALSIAPNHYLFFQTMYLIAEGKFVSGELEEKFGKIILSLKKTGFTEEERRELEALSEKRRKETHHAFSFIEKKLKTISPSYLQFKAYVLNDVERDLNDNFDYIQDLLEIYKKKKKVS